MSENVVKQAEPSVPNFYAIIPAVVRYDTSLRPNAKLIYGEISALTSAYGYCWATNQYFADLYGFAKKTVSELISELASRGYITVEVCRAKVNKGAGAVEMRKIWLNSRFDCDLTLSGKNRIGYPEKKGDPIPQKVKENNTSINNNPRNPQEGDARFDAFWKAYPHKMDKQKAVKSFRKLKVDDELLKVILAALEKQKRSPQWNEDEGRYIPYPATWLNNRRWEAEAANAAAPAQSAPSSEMGGVEEW